MDWLEQVKKQYADNEAVTNEVAAQAHIENYALKLFLYADKQDREENFGKWVKTILYTEHPYTWQYDYFTETLSRRSTPVGCCTTYSRLSAS